MKKFLLLFCLISIITNSKLKAQVGSALDFDGTDDYVTSSSSTFTAYTAEVWVKLSGSVASKNIVVYTNSGGPMFAFSHQLRTDASGHFVHYTYDGAGKSVVGTTVASLGTWYHVAIVAQNNGMMRLYVNGVEEGTAAAVGTLWAGGDRFYTGSASGGLSIFQGQLDELRIWNINRTASEIDASKNYEIPTNSSGLMANYHFNQGVAGGDNITVPINTLTDASGNSRTGTLNNFALTGATSNWVTPGAIVNGTLATPAISSFTPTSSGTGNSVTITGTNFYGVTSVSFGGTAASSYIVVSSTSIIATVAAGTSGSVSVTTGGGTASLAGFTYLTAPGNKLQLDGSGAGQADYIVIPDLNNSMDLQNNFTIESWIYITDATNNTIIDKGNYNYLFQTHSNGNTGLGLYNNNMGWIYSAGTIPTNKWVHVAVTFSTGANQVNFYMNGNLLSSHSGAVNPTLDNADVNIGRQSPSTCACNVMDGSIDELRVWNVVKTQAQIQASMNTTVSGASANLVAYYNMDVNAGTTVYDLTSNANNGTFVNTPTWSESYAMVVPTASAATGVGTTSFTTNWTAPTTGTVDNNYRLDVSTSSTFASFVTGYNGLSVAGTSQAVTGLNPVTTYYYRVRADKTSVTGQGCYSNTIAATTTKVSQTITFNALSASTYGDATFNLTATASSGLAVSYVSSDPTVASISGSTVTILKAGTTNITASQTGNSTYFAATDVIQTLTVNAKSLTITASDVSKTYGTAITGAAGSTAFISSGLVGAETIGTVTISYGTGSSTSDAVGTYNTVTPSAATGGTFTTSNYAITYSNGNIIVGTKALTITANDVNKTYGSAITGAAGSTAFTSSGLVGAETIGSVTIAYGTGATISDAVGTYTTVTPSAATGGTFTPSNYAITYTNGNVIVGTKALSVRANNVSKVYGTALVGSSGVTAFSSVGLVTGETIGSITRVYGSGAAATDPVATYTGVVTPSAATGGTFTASNYSITYVVGNITVTRALLTVTSNNQTRVYGAANPTLTNVITGFKNGETSAVLTTMPVSTCAALPTTPVGTVVTINAAGGAAANYNFTYVGGILTITKAVLTVTADDKTKVYNTANPAFTNVITGYVNSEDATALSTVPTSSCVATTTSNVGTYAITSSGGVAANYSFMYVSGTLTITKADQVITFSTLPTLTYGDPDFALTATSTSGLTVSFTSSDLTKATIVAGPNGHIVGGGNVTITADQVGDGNYNPAPSVAQAITILKKAQTINSFTTIGDHLISDAPFTLSATATSALIPTYTILAGTTIVSVVDSTVTLSGTVGGTVTVRVNQAGNGNYYAASPVYQTFVVNQLANTLVFNPIGTHYVNESPFDISSLATSTYGTVTFSGSDSTIAKVSSAGIVTPVKAGSIIVSAMQTGSAWYADALVKQSMTISSLTNTMTFAAIPNAYVNASNFSIASLVTATSNGAITFTGSNNTIATITTAGLIDPISAGTITITATQAATANYPASTITKSFTVVKVANPISFAAIPSAYFDATPIQLTASAPGGTVTYTGSSATIATVSTSGLITPHIGGTITITAKQAGDATYLASTTTQTFTVLKRANVVTLASISDVYVDAANFNVVATATNGAITYTSSSVTLASITTLGAVDPKAAGTVTIRAKTLATTTYLAGSATQTFVISKRANPITFTAVPTKIATDAAFSMVASAPRGTLTYTGSSASIATVSAAGLITPVGAGTLTVTIKQAGSTVYLASSVTTTIVISKATQTITWTTIANKTVGDADFTVAATASSGLAVTFTKISGPATIVGTNAHLTGTAGTAVFRATQAGTTKIAGVTQDITFNVASVVRMASSNSNFNTELEELTIKLFPNPSKGLISLEANNLITDVKVFDVTGKCVMTKSDFEETRTTSFDLSSLPKGMYNVQVLSNNQFIDRRVVLE